MKKLTACCRASLAVSLVLLTGCKEEEQAIAEVIPEEVQTVDWYKEHPEKRDSVLEHCDNNPGETEILPNCVNASKARQDNAWSSRGATQVEPLTAEDVDW